MKARGLKRRRFAILASTAALFSIGAGLAPHDSTLMAAKTPAVEKPNYWVAVLAVPMSEPEKNSFHPHLKDLFDGIGAQLGIQGLTRCIYSNMMTSPSQACIDRGKPVRNCERIELHWNEDTNEPDWLKLYVQEADPKQSSGPTGRIFEHRCPLNTFEQCFAKFQDEMQQAVRRHDELCHDEGCKCKVVNKTFQPCRVQ